jgi:NADH:ubiquinone oxidoreductase subunit F (NADH-binding)
MRLSAKRPNFRDFEAVFFFSVSLLTRCILLLDNYLCSTRCHWNQPCRKRTITTINVYKEIQFGTGEVKLNDAKKQHQIKKMVNFCII